MKTITVKTDSPYDIHIGAGILSRCGKRIAALSHQDYKQVVIITDNTVADLYGRVVADSIRAAGFQVGIFSFSDGEASKTMETVMEIIGFLSDEFFTRDDLIIALGGGVVGDVAGFVASVYQRGVDYIMIPTTIMAAIESSVGGKTGVDLPQAKDLIGTLFQPRLVICDTVTFATLENAAIADGVAETLKYGCIWDGDLFDSVACAGDKIHDYLVDIVAKCVAIKARIVAEDQYDAGIRQILKFGHTVGHAIETLSGSEISHGKAVAIGMVIAAQAGERIGVTQPGTAARISDVLALYGLPRGCGYDMAQIAELCKHERKRGRDEIHYILLEKIGKAVIHKVPVDELEDFLRAQ